MTTATRRGFVAGALAGAAAPALLRPGTVAAAAPAMPTATRPPVHRGRAIAVSPRGDRVVVAHDGLRTIGIRTRGGPVRLVEVGGRPVAVAVAPDGRSAAVTTASWDEPGLVGIDLLTGEVRRRADVGPAPGEVAYTGNGRRILVAGGEQEGTIHIVHAARLEVLRAVPIGLVPRGLAMTPDGRSAWVALHGLDSVVRIDARTGRITRELDTPPLPDRIAVSPDGRRLLVTHGGRDATRVSEIDVATRRVVRREAGRQPSAVAWTRRGRRLVALGGEGAIAVLGRSARPRRLRVGGSPRGLAVVGRRAWTVDALTGHVARVTT